MKSDFTQVEWDEQLAGACRQIVRLWVQEDLAGASDWTTDAMISEDQLASACLVARADGIVAGLPAVEVALDEMHADISWQTPCSDGDGIVAGAEIATLSGPARQLLTAERLVLNLIGRLSGIATWTRRYVDEVSGTKAAIYDTRKTTPGWRLLEKYAVRCGGGRNHRTGLFDAILIKDNHLAMSGVDPAEAVRKTRDFARDVVQEELIVEVEADTIEQLRQVLPAGPDIVLLDNMRPADLEEAVALRDATNAEVQLEASGGINLSTVKAIAQTGVDRISVGALTHAAASLDIGLDWRSG